MFSHFGTSPSCQLSRRRKHFVIRVRWAGTIANVGRNTVDNALTQSVNHLFCQKNLVTIKASKTKHKRTGQQGKTLTAAL